MRLGPRCRMSCLLPLVYASVIGTTFWIFKKDSELTKKHTADNVLSRYQQALNEQETKRVKDAPLGSMSPKLTGKNSLYDTIRNRQWNKFLDRGIISPQVKNDIHNIESEKLMHSRVKMAESQIVATKNKQQPASSVRLMKQSLGDYIKGHFQHIQGNNKQTPDIQKSRGTSKSDIYQAKNSETLLRQHTEEKLKKVKDMARLISDKTRNTIEIKETNLNGEPALPYHKEKAQTETQQKLKPNTDNAQDVSHLAKKPNSFDEFKEATEIKGGVAGQGLHKSCADIQIKKINWEPAKSIPFEQRELAKLMREKDLSFAAAAKEIVNDEKIIMISVVDYGYVDLFLNFYESVILNTKIKTLLPICNDMEAHCAFTELGIPCFFWGQVGSGSKATTFGNNYEWNRKVNTKMEVIIRLLDLGYSVFVSDVDVFYLADPMGYFHEDVDVVIQNGWEMLNPGLMFVNNTAASRELFKRTWNKVIKTNWLIKEQVNVDEEIKNMSMQKLLKYKVLQGSIFPCGKAYFKPRAVALDKPFGIVAVHNTHIKGLEEKIYRFKEHLFWINDRDGYYTSLDSRYIYYENPNIGFDNKTLLTETSALINAMAIANLTNRVLILPKFFCFGTHCSLAICPQNMTGLCPLSAHFIPRVLERTFKGQYRESTFLINPRVPYRVKRSASPPLLLDNFQNIAFNSNQDILLHPNNSSNQQHVDIFYEDFVELLEPYKKFRILNFTSLYYGFKGFKDQTKQKWFESKCKTGLIRRWKQKSV